MFFLFSQFLLAKKSVRDKFGQRRQFSHLFSRAELVPSPRAYAQNSASRDWFGNYFIF
jgi:hypothetical protein